MPEFRFLHISDVHLQDEKISGFISRKRLEEKLQTVAKDGSVQCLVISGDIFHKGKLNPAKGAGEFLQSLPGKDCIIVCPGNHDLDRDARIKTGRSKNEGMRDKYGQTLTRRELVNKYGKEAAEGRKFSFNETEKKVLYKEAFSEFQSFAKACGFKTYNAPGAGPMPENFEFQIYDIEFCDNNVRFVLLNTALLAGQSLDKEGYGNRVKEYWEKVQKASTSVEKAQEQLKLEKLKQEYGEIIIDNESQGRLSLSEEGLEKLVGCLRATPDSIVATIFVGHHGWDYLSSETQAALKEVMQDQDVYLCGHEHKPRVLGIPIKSNNTAHIYQYQAGAMYYDEGGWAQYGFNEIVIAVDDEGGRVEVICHYCIKDPAGNEDWYVMEPIKTQPRYKPGSFGMRQDSPDTIKGLNVLNDQSKEINTKEINTRTRETTPQETGDFDADDGYRPTPRGV